MSTTGAAHLRAPDAIEPRAAADRGRCACPGCGNVRLRRVRRRAVDRLLSMVRPVFRFRCTRPDCEWAGNVAQRHFARWSWGRQLRHAAGGGDAAQENA